MHEISVFYKQFVLSLITLHCLNIYLTVKPLVQHTPVTNYEY